MFFYPMYRWYYECAVLVWINRINFLGLYDHCDCYWLLYLCDSSICAHTLSLIVWDVSFSVCNCLLDLGRENQETGQMFKAIQEVRKQTKAKIDDCVRCGLFSSINDAVIRKCHDVSQIVNHCSVILCVFYCGLCFVVFYTVM